MWRMRTLWSTDTARRIASSYFGELELTEIPSLRDYSIVTIYLAERMKNTNLYSVRCWSFRLCGFFVRSALANRRASSRSSPSLSMTTSSLRPILSLWLM